MRPLRQDVFSFVFFFLACAHCAAAAGQIVLPVRDSVGVYWNENRSSLEMPFFTVSLEDRLVMIRSGNAHYLVHNRDGQEGWIEKSACVLVSLSTTLKADSILVAGTWDDLRKFILIDLPPVQQDHRLFIDRSFNGELLSNLDRDEMVKNAR